MDEISTQQQLMRLLSLAIASTALPEVRRQTYLQLRSILEGGNFPEGEESEAAMNQLLIELQAVLKHT